MSGKNLFMLPSNMELRIRSRTVGYNNKIIVSDGKFILVKNDEVNSLEALSAPQAETPAIKTNSLETPAISHKDSKPTADSGTAVTHKDLARKPTTTHEDEKIALILSLTGIFMVWYMFQ